MNLYRIYDIMKLNMDVRAEVKICFFRPLNIYRHFAPSRFSKSLIRRERKKKEKGNILTNNAIKVRIEKLKQRKIETTFCTLIKYNRINVLL